MSEWFSVDLHIVIDCPEYELALEECRNGDDQMMFIHLTVRKGWSISLLKRFQREWKIFREHVTCPLYAHGEHDDHKWAKFVLHFGFKHLVTVPGTDGVMKRIFWHPGNDLQH